MGRSENWAVRTSSHPLAASFSSQPVPLCQRRTTYHRPRQRDGAPTGQLLIQGSYTCPVHCKDIKVIRSLYNPLLVDLTNSSFCHLNYTQLALVPFCFFFIFFGWNGVGLSSYSLIHSSSAVSLIGDCYCRTFSG